MEGVLSCRVLAARLASPTSISSVVTASLETLPHALWGGGQGKELLAKWHQEIKEKQKVLIYRVLSGGEDE